MPTKPMAELEAAIGEFRTRTDDGATVEAELIATNQDGDAVVTGTASAELPVEP